MYLNYYRFREAPFNITPDPAFLYGSECHKEALASVVYGVEARKGYIALIGEVGSGKTTVLRAYLDSIDKQSVKAVCIFNPELTFEELVKMVCRDLDLPVPCGELAGAIEALQHHLIECYNKDMRVVVIIDEAHRMPIETLERLRVLSNLETDKAKLVQIVLCGQPELSATLERHELRQLRERIAVRAELRLLTHEESREYIRHRCALVGAEVFDVFDRAAVERVIRSSKGNPRKINLICDNALVTGYALRRKPIGAKIVNEVAVALKFRPPGTVFWKPAFLAAGAGLLLLLAAAYGIKGRLLSKPPGAPAALARVSAPDAADFLSSHTPGTAVNETRPVEASAQVTEMPESQEVAEDAEQTSVGGTAPGDETAVRAIDEAAGAEAPGDPEGAVLESLPEALADSENAPLGTSVEPVVRVEEQTGADMGSISQENVVAEAEPTNVEPSSRAEDEAISAAPSPRTFLEVRVLEGDSLHSICRRMAGRFDGKMLAEVLEINPDISDPDIIHPGQVLRVPITVKVSSTEAGGASARIVAETVSQEKSHAQNL